MSSTLSFYFSIVYHTQESSYSYSYGTVFLCSLAPRKENIALTQHVYIEIVCVSPHLLLFLEDQKKAFLEDDNQVIIMSNGGGEGAVHGREGGRDCSKTRLYCYTPLWFISYKL